MIFAIALKTESGDSYLFCDAGSPSGIAQRIAESMQEELAWVYSITVQPLYEDSIDYNYAEELKNTLAKLVDEAAQEL